MMRRVLLTMAVILMASPCVRAQQETQPEEPDEPEIVLPPVLLEVEDLSVERVEAAIPEGEELPAPSVDLPLPEPEELEIPDEAFDLPLPSEDEGLFDITRPERDIFSEGILGLGSMQHIVGSLSLYKLGTEPRFRLQFLHEGLNGFAEDYEFHDPGTGYFSTETLLSGSLELRFGDLSFDSAAAYQEFDSGMQGESDLYDSISHRFSSADLGAEYRASDMFTLNAGADARYTNAVGSVGSPDGDSPLDEAEFLLAPTIGVQLAFPYVNVGVEGWYGYRDIVDRSELALHRAGGMLSAEVSFPYPLYLDGSVGIAWTSEGPLRVPFSLGLSTTVGEMVTISAKGGYRVEQLNFSDLWRENPFLGIGDSLDDSAGFFVEGDLQWLLTPSFVLEGGVHWSDMEDAVIPEEDPEDDGLFLYDQGRMERLQPYAGFNWKLEEVVTLTGRWQAEIFDRTVFDPFYSFLAAVDITEPAGKFGASVSGELPIYDDLDLTFPELDLSGFVRVSEAFRFILEANDILSLGLQDGRRLLGPYIGPGFHITLKVQITL